MTWSNNKFGGNLVSDALVDAVRKVASGIQLDRKGNSLEVGDDVIITEGMYAGRLAQITGFHSTGSANVQLYKGAALTVPTSMVIAEAKTEDDEKDDSKDSDEKGFNFDKKKKKKAKKSDDDDDDDGDEDDEDSEEDEPKGKGEKVKINPNIDEVSRKLVDRYHSAAVKDKKKAMQDAEKAVHGKSGIDMDALTSAQKRELKRRKGIATAVGKLNTRYKHPSTKRHVTDD